MIFRTAFGPIQDISIAALEMHVLAYNLKRVMNIMGTRPLIAAMKAV